MLLQDVVFEPELDAKVYKYRRKELKERLIVLQQMAIKAKLGTVLIVEGWGAAGKGSRVSDLVVDLDPRAYMVHAMKEPNFMEMRLPFMARYWSRLSAHGEMTIFDQAYYEELSRSYVNEVTLKGEPGQNPAERDARAAYAEQRIAQNIESARVFEHQLQADGYLIVRIFLHITEEMQKERIGRLITDPSNSWKVGDDDIRQMQHYAIYEQVFNRWLNVEGDNGWVIVPAEHRRNANIQIMEALAQAMDAALQARGVDTSKPIPAYDDDFGKKPEQDEEPEPQTEEERKKAILARAKKNTGSAEKLVSRFELVKVKTLKESRTKKRAAYDERKYREELEALQQRLGELTLETYRHGIPLIIAYEGWDAAGKGGNIKRVTAAMDARFYKVHPIGAPSKEELAHPFLWRFWTKLPRTGHAAIFDRTWYGRVLVERIEGFATKEEWSRAYDEINEFEHDLENWGAVLIKFWLDVSPEEQLARFKAREEDPENHP